MVNEHSTTKWAESFFLASNNCILRFAFNKLWWWILMFLATVISLLSCIENTSSSSTVQICSVFSSIFDLLHQLYYSIIYPFLTYGLLIWGNTYSTNLKPLITLQKRAIRTITFSKPDEHSEPLFKELEILKLTDLVTLHNALFMYHYYYNLLPSSFENFFQTVASVHSYNTRLASKSTYYINTIKTNYGKFNIRFAAVKVWNHLDESIKYLPLKTFKNKVKLNILQSYCSWVFNW